jgi:hypothetical protein
VDSANLYKALTEEVMPAASTPAMRKASAAMDSKNPPRDGNLGGVQHRPHGAGGKILSDEVTGHVLRGA